MMTPDESIKALSELSQWDIDAIKAYEQAISNIQEMEIANTLDRFKQDHERHASELNQAIERLGGTPPSHSPDVKGFLIQGFTAIRSMTGTVGALKAMISNEKIINKTYAEASQKLWPEELKGLIEHNYSDERLHLDTIEKLVETLEQTSA